jgi:ribosomal protein S18 acetylase RimI-like enzyme
VSSPVPDPGWLAAACDLASRRWRATGYWHPGGLAWGLASGDATALQAWYADDLPVAWAMLDGSGHVSAQCDPEADATGELAASVIGWATAAPSGLLAATVDAGETGLRSALTRVGLAEPAGAPYFLDLRRSLDDLPPVVLPAGFTVRPTRADEAAARAAAHRDAWSLLPVGEGLPVTSSFDEAAYRVVAASPGYRHDLDLVVTAPDGELVATCTAWLDPASRSAELEPVGTSPRHRRLGLASAVCLAAMHELAALGATAVTVHPRGDDGYPAARAVYQRIGFAAVGRTMAYWRDRSEPAVAR